MAGETRRPVPAHLPQTQRGRMPAAQSHGEEQPPDGPCAAHPSRIACLWVPELPLAALLRAEPALRDRPVAVQERAAIVAASPEAREAGVVPGMTAVQARSLLPALELRALSPALVRSALAALEDVARAFSPRVATGERLRGAAAALAGEVYLDTVGLGRLHASEQVLGEALAVGMRRVRLAGRVGIGAGLLCARLAASLADGSVLVIPPGREAAFLAPLSVALIDGTPRVQATLARFGVERLGQLAALPGPALGRRLGPEGLRLWRLSRGEEEIPFSAAPAALRFAEELDCDFGLDRLEPLLAALRAVLERLFERLESRGLGPLRLHLAFRFETGQEQRSLALRAQSADRAAWLGVLGAALEQSPPAGPVVGLRVEAETAPLRRAQLDLFARAAAAQGGRFDDALAALVALAGEERVGSPRPRDSHRPDDFVQAPRPTALAQGVHAGPAARGPAARGLAKLPLRALRPPCPVKVEIRAGRLSWLRGGRIGGQILRTGGPWRVEADWWRDPLRRDYYDVELQSGLVLRLFQDRISNAWFVDGICG